MQLMVGSGKLETKKKREKLHDWVGTNVLGGLIGIEKKTT